MTTFSPDAAAALAGPAVAARRPHRRGRALRGLGPAVDGGGDLALQPHRRARPRRLRARSPASPSLTTVALPRGVVVRVAGEDDAELPGSVMDEPTDVFAELNTAFAAPVVVRVPPGVAVAEPIVVEHHVAVDGGAIFPRLVVELGEDAEATVVERFTSADVHALVVPVAELRAGQNARLRYLRSTSWASGCGRSARRWPAASATRTRCSPRWRSAATTPASAPTPGSSAKGAEGEQIAVYFGEGDADARLPHAAGPRRTEDPLEPAVQGGGGGPRPQRLHRPHPGAEGGPRHRRLPDEPQPEALRARLGRERAQPRHRDERRALLPRQHGRARSTRTSASTWRAAACAPADAERLIVLGFFDEVLERLPARALVPELVGQVAAKLDRRDA